MNVCEYVSIEQYCQSPWQGAIGHKKPSRCFIKRSMNDIDHREYMSKLYKKRDMLTVVCEYFYVFCQRAKDIKIYI